MKMHSFPLVTISVACMVMVAPALRAQTAIQLFTPVDTRVSLTSATYSNPDVFNTTTLTLTCNASPISAILSGPLMNYGGSAPELDGSGNLQAGGNLLVDNNILVTVTPAGGSPGAPVNVCANGIAQGASYNGQSVPPLLNQNCFQSGYADNAGNNSLNNQDPDTFVPPGDFETVDAAGGVEPIQIGGDLVSGTQNVTIALNDEGGWFVGSSLFLTTNCTPAGVTGPAQVTGNTIGSNPTPGQLAQTFTFNPVTEQVVGFIYNLTNAQNQNTLISNTGESTPQVTDLPVNPATFQSNFAANTSFATSECLIHSGEVGGPLGQAATQPACKLYTLECTNGTNPTAAGALCPISSAPNEVVQDIFDGPAFTLQDIPTPGGPTFHEGIGFLMASEGWGAEGGVPPGTWNWNGGTGGPCAFDPAANLNLPCPQNLLTSFTGPGTFSGTGETTHPNSTFISIAGVPEDLTHVNVMGATAGNWVNNSAVKVQFSSVPPNLQGTGLPGAANFIPSPIQSITYGVSPLGNTPLPVNEPINGDTTVLNTACPIPTAANPGPAVAPTFTPGVQTLHIQPDGQYLLHYFAQDCAGTQELLFQQAGSWTTNFYTVPINVDTVPPQISAVQLTGAMTAGYYNVGESVTASYSCSDATSGVVTCGTQTYGTGISSTGALTAPADTSSPGQKTFTVNAVDAAGNQSSKSVSYTVVGSTPLITGVYPPYATVATGAFYLTLTGDNFTSGQVYWGNTPLASSLKSSTKVSALVPASLITQLGSTTITVGSGAGPSNGIPYSILLPPPTITSLSPNSRPLNGPTFVMAIHGTNFTSSTTVYWWTVPLVTTFVNSGEVTVQIPSSFLANPSYPVPVEVINASGTSNVSYFTISAPPL